MDQHHHEDGKVSIDERESDEESLMELRRGPWTVDEDFTLINYIAHHGEGRWNSLARCAGLKRTGKSCRLRWLNYLRPDVRRGNITLEEQLLILELHSRWGNRWSKIAQHLPGRTDNEIKNYWRTRVQKHAKQLKCDVNSKQFKDTMRYLWMPRLVERIQAAAAATTAAGCGGGGGPMVASSATTSSYHHQLASLNSPNIDMGSAQIALQHSAGQSGSAHTYTPENSASSESFGTPGSDLTDCYNNIQDYYPAPNVNQFNYGDQNLTSPSGFYNQGLGLIEPNGEWMDGGDASGNLWDVDDMWFLQQQFNSNA